MQVVLCKQPSSQNQHAVSCMLSQSNIRKQVLQFLSFTAILRGCCVSSGQSKWHTLLHMIVRAWLPAL